MKRYAYLFIVMALLVGWIPNPQAWAQKEEPYPTKGITYLICFNPGGQSDVVARMQQPLLENILKQRVTIDYIIGGGGSLGWRDLVRAKPDGYTMAGIDIPTVILQPLKGEVKYKTEQMVPVAIFQRTPRALAVLKKSPYKTYQEFVDAARKNPGKLMIAGTGTFSGSHVAVLRLEKLAGAKLAYIGLTGAATQMEEFLRGQVDAIFGTSDSLIRYRDKIRVLAFATEKRFAAFPDVPTFRELNVDLLEAMDLGSAVPLKTPDYIIKRLEAAFLNVAADPKIQADMKRQGFIPVAMGHDESVAHVKKMTALYKELTVNLAK